MRIDTFQRPLLTEAAADPPMKPLVVAVVSGREREGGRERDGAAAALFSSFGLLASSYFSL